MSGREAREAELRRSVATKRLDHGLGNQIAGLEETPGRLPSGAAGVLLEVVLARFSSLGHRRTGS